MKVRSYSVLLRREPLFGNDRTTLEVSTKSSFSRFLSTLGSCWGSLRLPNLQQVWLHSPNLLQVWLYSPNLQQVWLFLPHLQQVWLTQDQLGAFPAVLSAAPSAAPSATLPTVLYLLHKIRTYDAHRVARKTSVFFALKPLVLVSLLVVRAYAGYARGHSMPRRACRCSPRVCRLRAHTQSSAI